MNTLHSRFCHLWGGSAGAPLNTRHVPLEMTDSLRRQGLGRPLTSLDDPRLDCPELLLLTGYRWLDTGYYEARPHPSHYQVVAFNDDEVCIRTRCGQRMHEARRSSEGEITQRTWDLPGLDVLL